LAQLLDAAELVKLFGKTLRALSYQPLQELTTLLVGPFVQKEGKNAQGLGNPQPSLVLMSKEGTTTVRPTTQVEDTV
jgi:hypothetical protein